MVDITVDDGGAHETIDSLRAENARLKVQLAEALRHLSPPVHASFDGCASCKEGKDGSEFVTRQEMAEFLVTLERGGQYQSGLCPHCAADMDGKYGKEPHTINCIIGRLQKEGKHD